MADQFVKQKREVEAIGNLLRGRAKSGHLSSEDLKNFATMLINIAEQLERYEA